MESEAEHCRLSEVNEVKRLYERNVRVDYLNPTNPSPEKLVRATNIDSALRKFVEDNAAKNGFPSLYTIAVWDLGGGMGFEMELLLQTF